MIYWRPETGMNWQLGVVLALQATAAACSNTAVSMFSPFLLSPTYAIMLVSHGVPVLMTSTRSSWAPFLMSLTWMLRSSTSSTEVNCMGFEPEGWIYMRPLVPTGREEVFPHPLGKSRYFHVGRMV